MTKSARFFDRFDSRIQVALGASAVLATLLAWQCPKVMDPEESFPPIYDLRVVVLSETNEVVRDSTVDVSTNSEAQLLRDGWWQIEIPEKKVHADRRVTVIVSHDGFEPAKKSVELRSDPNPRMEVVLKRPPAPSNTLVGTLLDLDDRPVSGARVQVKGHAVEVVETDADGRFLVEVPLAAGEKVLLHVDHGELGARSASCYLGAPCEIWMRGPEPAGDG